MAKLGTDVLRNIYLGLKQERANIDVVYDLVDRFVVPGRGRLATDDSENGIDWHRRELYDDTAVQAAQILAASIHGALTSPAIRWYGMRYRDQRLNDDHLASVWLEEVTGICIETLQRSNLNVEIGESYLGDVSFGMAYLSHLADKNANMRFKNLDIKGAYFTEDFLGEVNGMYIEKEYTILALYGRFKDGLPEKYIKMVTEDPARAAAEKVTVIHAIYEDIENANNDPSKLLTKDERRFRESYFMLDPIHELEEGDGYYEFPIYVFRWGSCAGSKFGYSPAINAMGNILTLNQLVQLVLSAAEKVIDPPVLATERGIIGDLNFAASHVNIVRDIQGIKPWESTARFDVSALTKKELVESIKDAFYIDKLQLKESPAMTATEANIRYELMQRLLGPAVTRIKTAVLDKLVHRTFLILYRAGKLPEMPPIVKELGGDYEIDYIGPWARAQRADDVLVLEQALGYAVQMSANMQDPELMRPFDTDGIMRELALKRGMPAKYIKDQKRIDREREQDQQQQQLAQAVALMQQGAAAGRDVAASQKLAAEAQSVAGQN